MGAVIAITFILACLITLAVTALITYMITSYKHWHDKVKGKVDNNRDVSIEQEGPRGDNITRDNDPIYETVTPVIKVENPTYGTATIKMDVNPAYA